MIGARQKRTNGSKQNGPNGARCNGVNCVTEMNPRTPSKALLVVSASMLILSFCLGCVFKNTYMVSDANHQRETQVMTQTEQCNNNEFHRIVSDIQIDHKHSDDANDTHSIHASSVGQVLLVDMTNLDGIFLQSEKQIVHIMKQAMSDSNLELLFYQCQPQPHSKGMNCAGVLTEGHISLQTLPKEGIMMLEVFARYTSNLLTSILPSLERNFVAAKTERSDSNSDGSNLFWSLKLRGHRPRDESEQTTKNGIADLIYRPMMRMDEKKKVATFDTEFRRVDIYDVVDLNLGVPNRMVFFDGKLETSSLGDVVQHEAFVHPGMMTQDAQRRVSIIGGGYGAILREVLKYRTVDYVQMFEMDEELVRISREHLSPWNDCSDIVGSTNCCFDDDRVDIYHEDGIEWFASREFSHAEVFDEDGSENEDDSDDDDEEEEDYSDKEVQDSDDDDDHKVSSHDDTLGDKPFDVIILNTVVSQDTPQFMKSIYDALSPEGMLIMKLGDSPFNNDVVDEIIHTDRAMLIKTLSDLEYKQIKVYEESRGKFNQPRLYLIAAKYDYFMNNLYRNQAHVNVDHHNEFFPTKSGLPPVNYVDGATKNLHVRPPKVLETMFCRRDPKPLSCITKSGFNPFTPIIYVNGFEVKMSSVGDFVGRGVFAAVDIPKGAYIMSETCVQSVEFRPFTADLVQETFGTFPDANELHAIISYMDGYGYENNVLGMGGYYVDSGILTFMNHGCNGSNNYGPLEIAYGHPRESDSLTEVTADPNYFPYDNENMDDVLYDPVLDRHYEFEWSSTDGALKDIKKGEEMFCSYLLFTSIEVEWADTVSELREQCQGAAGLVVMLDTGDSNGIKKAQ